MNETGTSAYLSNGDCTCNAAGMTAPICNREPRNKGGVWTLLGLGSKVVVAACRELGIASGACLAIFLILFSQGSGQ